MEPAHTIPLLGFYRAHHGGVMSTEQHRLCMYRARKRWSALLTQKKSRIGFKCGMRKRLGENHWATFVRYATTNCKKAFIRALVPANGILCCAGKIDGTPCPNKLTISLLTAPLGEVKTNLPKLHMDHEFDVKQICDVWSRALPEEPKSWDDGICGELVAHLLFGVRDHPVAKISARRVWQKNIVIRCGDARGIADQHAENYCHDVSMAHYNHVLKVEDILWPDKNDESGSETELED